MTFDVANLNPVELVWLIVAAVGLFFATTNLRQSELDRDRAEDVRNGLRDARIVVAAGYVYRNRIRVAIFVWWVFLGVLFGFFDPPDVPRIAGLLGLIATALGFALVGAQESVERRALAAIISRQRTVDATDAAADTVERRAAVVAANLEIVAQEAALRLRQIAREGEGTMAVDQKRSADAAERTADSLEGLLSDQSEQESST